MRAVALIGCGLVAGCSVLFDPSGGSDAGPRVDGDQTPVDGAVGADGVAVECPEDTIALYHFDAVELHKDSCTAQVDLSFDSGGLSDAVGYDGGGVTFTTGGQLLKAAPLLNSPAIKFEAWVNPSRDTVRDALGVVGWNDANGPNNMALRVLLNRASGTSWRVTVEHSVASCTVAAEAVVSDPAITSGEFHHLAITHDPSDLVIYVDGQSVGGTTTGTTLCEGLDGTRGYLAVGAGSDDLAASDLFEGVIDEVRISANSDPPVLF